MIQECKASELEFLPLLDPPEKTENSSNRYFIFNDRKIVLINENNSFRLPSEKEIELLEIKTQRTQYIGELKGSSCFVSETNGNFSAIGCIILEDLRNLSGVIGESVASVAGRAIHLLEWDHNTRYCGRCGSATFRKQDERAKQCPDCGLLFFPKISPAIIVMIEKDNEILMARSSHFPAGRYGLIAGFVEPGESIEEAIVREVMEEVGICIKDISYFGSQPWPYPDSLMIGFTAKFSGGEICFHDGEIEDADWFRHDEIPHVPGSTSISGKLVEYFMSKHI